MIGHIVLHIGTYKTGTTSIQAVLRRNRQALAARGVTVSEVLKPGHGPLMRYALDDERAPLVRRLKGELDAGSIARWRAKVVVELDALAAAGTELLILSDEGLSGGLSQGEVDRLRDLLRPRAERVEVVVYLRPQHERRISDYSQALRNGKQMPAFFEADEASLAALRYDDLTARFSAAFGQAMLRPRLYQPHLLQEGDAVSDFFGCVGIDRAGLKPPPHRNPGLSAGAQAWLGLLNAHMPRVIDDQVNVTRERAMRALGDHFGGSGALPTRAEAEAFFASFAEGNEAVRKTWFPERTQLFDVDFQAIPVAGASATLTLDEAARMTAVMLDRVATDAAKTARRELRKAREALRADGGGAKDRPEAAREANR
ncbi:MAG: hypothetical protein AAGE18_09700 [Pseudomonadota bacterium]